MAGRRTTLALLLAGSAWSAAFVGLAATPGQQTDTPTAPLVPHDVFDSSDKCLACHNGLSAATGHDISIGTDWQTSMMANSARDPYWMAAVRRESMDYPDAQATIEDECSICHMPTSTFTARAAGGRGHVFARLAADPAGDPEVALAREGVTCTVCHQVQPVRLGDPSTFTGGFVIDTDRRGDDRQIFGPFEMDEGRQHLMRSASGFTPTEATHVQESGLCATCHMLITHALAEGAGESGRLPEQAPYVEWLHSGYRETRSCQSCHMPEVEGEARAASVLGQPREAVSRHTFVGGNFFMMRVLNRFRDELGTPAPSANMESAIARTLAHLREDTARLSITSADRQDDQVTLALVVANQAGHKFPTGYPSRRAWLQVTVTDGSGDVLFESGRPDPTGRIHGNDNDEDAGRFEPHYSRIERADQVQIYESIMVDPRDRVTTGLLSGVRYIKDNRLLPDGFDKRTAPADAAVFGEALYDEDFAAGSHRVEYVVPVRSADGPLTIDARLWFQPIGFRWAENLRDYDAPEPRRFLRYWDELRAASTALVAESRLVVP